MVAFNAHFICLTTNYPNHCLVWCHQGRTLYNLAQSFGNLVDCQLVHSTSTIYLRWFFWKHKRKVSPWFFIPSSSPRGKRNKSTWGCGISVCYFRDIGFKPYEFFLKSSLFWLEKILGMSLIFCLIPLFNHCYTLFAFNFKINFFKDLSILIYCIIFNSDMLDISFWFKLSVNQLVPFSLSMETWVCFYVCVA